MEENCRKKWVSSPKKRFYWLSEVFTIYHLILMTLYIAGLLADNVSDIYNVQCGQQIIPLKLISCSN